MATTKELILDQENTALRPMINPNIILLDLNSCERIAGAVVDGVSYFFSETYTVEKDGVILLLGYSKIDSTVILKKDTKSKDNKWFLIGIAEGKDFNLPD